jgi:hypothetical protein
MRLRNALFLLAVLGLVGGGIYVGFFKRDWWMPYYKKGRQAALGFTPAKSPQEAVNKFRDAMKAREYEAAALYCTADYADELHRVAGAGTALGTAIDALEQQMDTSGVLGSDRGRVVLMLLEPFPRETRVVDLQEQGDDSAELTIQEDFGALRPPDPGSERWYVNLPSFHALAGGPDGLLASGLPMKVDIVREEEGDDEAWKLSIPVGSDDRKHVDELINSYRSHIAALDRVREDMRISGASQFNVEFRLRRELGSAK